MLFVSGDVTDLFQQHLQEGLGGNMFHLEGHLAGGELMGGILDHKIRGKLPGSFFFDKHAKRGNGVRELGLAEIDLSDNRFTQFLSAGTGGDGALILLQFGKLVARVGMTGLEAEDFVKGGFSGDHVAFANGNYALLIDPGYRAGVAGGHTGDDDASEQEFFHGEMMG